jgi:hypothetical protein
MMRLDGEEITLEQFEALDPISKQNVETFDPESGEWMRYRFGSEDEF